MDVSVQDVVRTFGATPALHGVSLDIAAGELIALLGAPEADVEALKAARQRSNLCWSVIAM